MGRVRRPSEPASRAPWVTRLLIAVLVGIAATMAGATPTPAQAEPAAPVQVELTDLSPTVLSADATVRLSGRITNTSDQTITSPQVLLWRDLAPITSTEQLDATLASPPTLPIGARVVEVPSAYTQHLPAEMAPQQTFEFTVSAPVKALGLPSPNALYLLGVHVRGVYDRMNQTVGRARTFAPFENGKPPTVAVTDIIALSSRPSYADGVFTDAHLAGEIAPGGRLDVLLQAAATRGTSVAVDPATLAEIDAMTRAYQVVADDGSVVDGTEQDTARDWLSRWNALGGDRWRLPWASPDLAAMAHNGDGGLAGYSVRATAAEQLTDDLPTLVIPAQGGVDAGVVRLAARFEPEAVLARGLSSPVVRVDGQRLVDFDAGAFAGGPGPDPSTTAVQLRQRLLADTLLAALAGRKTPVVHVVDTAEGARAAMDASAGHVRRTPLDELLATTTAVPGEAPAYPEQLRAQELTALQLTEASALAHAYRASADLQVDSDAVKGAADRTVSRATSAWWRSADKSSRRWTRERTDAQQAQLAGTDVRVITPPRAVMSGRDGFFPVTITNKLDVPVRVSVRFTADNPQRLRISDLTDITVQPGESVTRTIEPHATANGTYLARAQLMTSSGISIGRAASITVQASNIGKAGWIIVIGSGIVLLGGTVLRIRQVRRYGKGSV